jgi:hypothetical protein
LAGLSCGIMKKMFAFIEPEVPNTENSKFTICYNTVHISICAKYRSDGAHSKIILQVLFYTSTLCIFCCHDAIVFDLVFKL